MLIDIHKTDEKGNFFTLREKVVICWRNKPFIIPIGFESDGASVPRFFWRVVFPPSDNRAIRAAFAHDYIYRIQPLCWTRAEADRMFYELLIEDGIPPGRAFIAYLGVRIFGEIAWKENAKK